MKVIEIQVLDKNGNVEYSLDFDTKKEARAWVKQVGKDRGFWVRLSESEYYPTTLDKIELLVNGECEADWFLKFAA